MAAAAAAALTDAVSALEDAECLLLELSHALIAIVTHELCDPLQSLLAVHLSTKAKVELQLQCMQLRATVETLEALWLPRARSTLKLLHSSCKLTTSNRHTPARASTRGSARNTHMTN